MDSEMMMFDMFKYWNQQRGRFAQNFQEYGQERIRQFAESARIIYVGNDALVQIDQDTFKKLDVRVLDNFRNVVEINISYEIMSAEVVCGHPPVIGMMDIDYSYDDNIIVFKCRDLKELLIHFYDVSQYQRLFNMIRNNNDFQMWLAFMKVEVVYADGTVDDDYQSLELFIYHFLYQYY